MHACSDTQEKTREGLGVRRSRADGNRRYLGDYRVERETVKAAQETDRWLAGEDAEPTLYSREANKSPLPYYRETAAVRALLSLILLYYTSYLHVFHLDYLQTSTIPEK